MTIRYDHRKAMSMLATLNLTRCWQIYQTQPAAAELYEERTIRDIVSKLAQYGQISDKQIEFLRKLLVKIDGRAVVEAERQAAYQAAGAAPLGRLRVTGTVVSVQEKETNWGPKTYCLIVTREGWKCYGTRFSDIDKGDVVTFMAEIKPAPDDPKFAFYKRAKLISLEPRAPENNA